MLKRSGLIERGKRLAYMYAVLILCAILSLTGSNRVYAQSAFIVLHSFGDGDNAATPSSGLLQANDGNLYGTTSSGGSNGQGTVFQISLSGQFKILHNFGDGSTPNDGAVPFGTLVQGTDGNLYGTTSLGGSTASSKLQKKGQGTVYKMTMDGHLTVLHSFGDGLTPRDGSSPSAGLTIGKDGDFYGTTASGGAVGIGTVFKISTKGVVTILHSFGDDTVSNDGGLPTSELIQGSDGTFYGTTREGGSALRGCVFSMSPTGRVTILHSFEDGSILHDGATPEAGVVQGSDGKLYGTTIAGGGAGHGVIFKMTTAGDMTIINNSTYASIPQGGLALGSDGNLYGTSIAGGSSGQGTVFEIDPNGGLGVLHNFGDGTVTNDGASPKTALVSASDGNLYGVTPLGGSKGVGVVFQMAPLKAGF